MDCYAIGKVHAHREAVLASGDDRCFSGFIRWSSPLLDVASPNGSVLTLHERAWYR
jgi:hypothetical protein